MNNGKQNSRQKRNFTKQPRLQAFLLDETVRAKPNKYSGPGAFIFMTEMENDTSIFHRN